MSNDTPYLLRMEMIKLAQQRASEQFHANWNAAAETRLNESAQLLTEVPVYPSADAIIEEAKKFKSFVDNS